MPSSTPSTDTKVEASRTRKSSTRASPKLTPPRRAQPEKAYSSRPKKVFFSNRPLSLLSHSHQGPLRRFFECPETFFPLAHSVSRSSAATARASRARRHEALHQDAQGLQLRDRGGPLHQGTPRSLPLLLISRLRAESASMNRVNFGWQGLFRP